MSNQQQDPGRDPDLGKAAEALGAAWTKLEQTEPPDMLDQAILNAARRDLEQRTRRVRRRWLGALTTAAVVVLALAITVQQDQLAGADSGPERSTGPGRRPGGIATG